MLYSAFYLCYNNINQLNTCKTKNAVTVEHSLIQGSMIETQKEIRNDLVLHSMQLSGEKKLYLLIGIYIQEATEKANYLFLLKKIKKIRPLVSNFKHGTIRNLVQTIRLFLLYKTCTAIPRCLTSSTNPLTGVNLLL